MLPTEYRLLSDVLSYRSPQEKLDFVERLALELSHSTSISDLPVAHILALYAAQEKPEAKRADAIGGVSQAVFAYLLRLLQSNDMSVPTLSAIIDICQTNYSLTRKMVKQCTDEIETATQQSRAPAAPDYPEHQSPNRGAFLLPTVICCLRFTLVLVWSSCELGMEDQVSLLGPIMAAIRHPDLQVSSHATRVAMALVSELFAVSPLGHAEHPDWLCRIWKEIYCLVSESWRSPMVVVGLSLWLRLQSATCSTTTYGHDRRSELLQLRLCEGTKEQQKLALAILKDSTEHDCKVTEDDDAQASETKRATQKQVMVFATVYESVVLTGYLNQVIESLPTLDTLIQSNSRLNTSFIFALLSAAMSKDAHYSIRRVTGEWVLQAPTSLMTKVDAQALQFVQNVFLPWAGSGAFFTSTLRKSPDGTMVCRHGENLKNFVTRISSAIDSKKVNLSLDPILSYLIEGRQHVFAFTRTYLLEGVVSGVCASDSSLTERQMEMLVNAATTAGFPTVASDYVLLLCIHLLKKTDAPQILVERLAQLDGQQHNLYTNVWIQTPNAAHQSHQKDNDTSPQYGLDAFAAKLKKTRHACLAGSALITACEYVQTALANTEERTLDTENLTYILEALLEEIEVQEHPKATLIRMPSIVLHPTCVILSITYPRLKQALLCILDQMHDLSNNRIYVFSALAQAWRRAVKDSPYGALQLCVSDFIKHFALHPPVATAEFELETIFALKLSHLAPDRSYETYYGKPLAYAYACVFDLLNSMPRTIEYNGMSMDMLEQLLKRWCKQKSPAPVFSPWKSTTQLQVLLLLCERSLTYGVQERMSAVYEGFIEALAVEMLPRNRFLLEWIIARFLHHQPERRKEILKAQGELDLTNPKNSTSMMKLSLMAASMPNTDEEFGMEFATQLILLSASAKVVIRHEAQWIFPQLWTLCQQRGWNKVLKNVVFSRMNETIRNLEAYKTPPPGRLHEGFDPIRDHNLTNLVQGRHTEMEPSESPKLTREDFLAVWHDDKQNGRLKTSSTEEAGEVVPLLALGDPRHTKRISSESATTAIPQEAANPLVATSKPLQTKNKLPADAGLKFQSLLNDMSAVTASEAGSTPTAASRPAPLILIASLIANPHNLGGLSRVSEILGAAEMHVHSLTPTASKDFTTVSVSSHFHLPILCLPITEIAAFLIAKKLAGYEVVGVEQTDRSKVLGSDATRFRPDGKTVLVLGSEREGIPAALLSEMDWCVEVQQVGVTRSMNVQTAAGVVMHEYLRQRRVLKSTGAETTATS